MTARGLMTFDELGAKLEELANTREVALQELEASQGRHRRDLRQLAVRCLGKP
jgi:hypothetical protein